MEDNKVQEVISASLPTKETQTETTRRCLHDPIKVATIIQTLKNTTTPDKNYQTKTFCFLKLGSDWIKYRLNWIQLTFKQH